MATSCAISAVAEFLVQKLIICILRYGCYSSCMYVYVCDTQNVTKGRLAWSVL